MTLYPPEKLEIGKLYRSLGSTFGLYSQPTLFEDYHILRKSFIRTLHGSGEVFLVIGPPVIVGPSGLHTQTFGGGVWVCEDRSYCTVEILTASEQPALGYFHCHTGTRCFEDVSRGEHDLFCVE